MKKTWQLILSGVGGQGLMLAGKLLGSAATGYEGKNAVMTSAYGVETRGTFAKSDVIVSDEEIDYPEVLKADVVIALAPVAYRKYAASLDEDTVLIYDNVIESMQTKSRQIGFPISKIAGEAGSDVMVNIVSLGILIKLTGIVSEQAVENVILEEFQGKEKLTGPNLRALKGGLEAAAGITISPRKPII